MPKNKEWSIVVEYVERVVYVKVLHPKGWNAEKIVEHAAKSQGARAGVQRIDGPGLITERTLYKTVPIDADGDGQATRVLLDLASEDFARQVKGGGLRRNYTEGVLQNGKST